MKRSRKTIEQLEELVLKRNVDVTMQHTNGHALDTYRASNPRENDSNAKSMSPGTTRATQGDHRWHKLPRLPRKNHTSRRNRGHASHPRKRVHVTSEGDFSVTNEGLSPKHTCNTCMLLISLTSKIIQSHTG